jgi:Flp pilus assembly protein TadD
VSDAEERLRILLASVEEEPDDPLGHYLLGTEYAALDRHDEAIASFRRAIDCMPDYTAAFRDLGKALRAAGRLEEARKAFEQGLAVADRTHDVQTAKEIRVFLGRLKESGTPTSRR